MAHRHAAGSYGLLSGCFWCGRNERPSPSPIATGHVNTGFHVLVSRLYQRLGQDRDLPYHALTNAGHIS